MMASCKNQSYLLLFYYTIDLLPLQTCKNNNNIISTTVMHICKMNNNKKKCL